MGKRDYHPIIEQWREFDEINQRLKTECNIYYINKNRDIYMKPKISYIQKFAKIRNHKEVDLYLDALYDAERFFQFSKLVKITKLECDEQTFELWQNDIRYKIEKIDFTDDNKIEKILNGMKTSNKFLEYIKNIPYASYRRLPINISHFLKTESMSNLPLYDSDNNKHEINLTKELFPSLKKKDDYLTYHVLDDEDAKNVTTVMFMHVSEDIDIYTMVSFIDFI